MSGRTEPSTAVLQSSPLSTTEQRPGGERPWSVGTTLGRYIVLESLGRGGMATVYGAYDPKLDRRVALKIMRGRFERSHGRQLLLREAQSLAKLSHPNIVTVHDVGLDNGHLFLVMEQVHGAHLRRWVREDKPRPLVVLRACIDAARGLAAVHRAGVLHCDVKPDNILRRQQDGRVQVADFGLARLRSTMTTDGSGPSFATRAYLAPEVFEGGDLGVTTDIFAFCVSVVELLLGDRPGPLPPGRASALRIPGIPRRAVRELARGLSAEPKARPASMDALVTGLERALSRRGRYLAAGIATVAAAAGAVALSPQRPSCEQSNGELREYWDSHRDRVGEALRGRASHLAEDAATKIDGHLDAYVQRLSDMRVTACEAERQSESRGDYSESTARAIACLEQRKDAALAWVDVLAGSEDSRPLSPDDVQLPPLDLCEDLDLLAHSPAPPDDRAQWTSVGRARRRLGEAAAHRHAGQLDTAAGILAPLGPTTVEIDYTPLRAEFELERGRLYRAQRHYSQAEGALYRAVSLSERSGHDLVRLEAWIELSDHYGDDVKRLPAADVTYRAAAAALAGLGHPAEPSARLDLVRGRTLIHNDRFREGCDLFASLQDDPPPTLPLDVLQHELGWCHWALGDPKVAVGWFQQAHSARVERLGSEHPDVAKTLLGMGRARSQLIHDQEQFDRATRELHQAYEIMRRAYGPHTLPTALALTAMGAAAARRGDLATGQTHLEAAVAIVDEHLDGESAFDVAPILSTLGSIYSRRGLHLQAKNRLEQARTMLHDSLGPRHSRNALPTINLAYAAKRAGDPAAAILWFHEAVQLVAPLDQRRTQQAELMLEQAELLWDTGIDPRLARRRAQEAIDVARTESVGVPQRAQRWLDAHPEGPLAP